jgi:hypothetical protein
VNYLKYLESCDPDGANGPPPKPSRRKPPS